MNMKRYHLLLPAAAITLSLLAGACHRRNEAKERVMAEREAWEASLPDSLKAVERQSDSLRNEIQTLSQQIEDMLTAFDYVENPREVEGYYIAKAWKASYPLKTTSLVARLSKGERLELIAALAGGAHFDQIRVDAAGESATSSVVPHDQALNYRMASLNTVCFADSASDSCAALIAAHSGEDIRVSFLNAGKTTGTLRYPAASARTMAQTWNLADAQERLRHDERLIPLLARKGAIISEKIEKLKKP